MYDLSQKFGCKRKAYIDKEKKSKMRIRQCHATIIFHAQITNNESLKTIHLTIFEDSGICWRTDTLSHVDYAEAVSQRRVR